MCLLRWRRNSGEGGRSAADSAAQVGRRAGGHVAATRVLPVRHPVPDRVVVQGRRVRRPRPRLRHHDGQQQRRAVHAQDSPARQDQALGSL